MTINVLDMQRIQVTNQPFEVTDGVVTLKTLFGTGSPEGSQTAEPGSSYVDTSSGKEYRKLSGSGNTGWVTLHQISAKGQIVTRNTAGNLIASNAEIYVDTDSGEVGIANTSPDYKLDIGDAVGISNVATTPATNADGFVLYGKASEGNDIARETVLLLLGDGTNGSTTFTDTAQGLTASSVSGAPSISTTSPKFGTGSIRFNGASAIEYSNDDSKWVGATSGGFTIDSWVKVDAAASQQMIATYGADANNFYAVWIDATGVVRFTWFDAGLAVIDAAAPSALSAATWHHIAVVREWTGATYSHKVYIDGAGGTADTDTGVMQTLLAATSMFQIGDATEYSVTAALGATNPLTGNLDGFRVTRTALYTADFTAPTGPPGSGVFLKTKNGTEIELRGVFSNSATIEDNSVTNSKIAQMPANTLKGNNTGSTGGPSDLTTTQVKAMLSVDDLVTLSGVADGATSLGTFTGATIADNVTMKAALQSLESAVETVTGTTNLSYTASATQGVVVSDTGTDATIPAGTGSDAGLMLPAQFTKLSHIAVTQAVDLDQIESREDNLITLSGVAAASTSLGTFTGTTITDGQTIKAAIQELETAVETKLSSTLTSAQIFVGNGSNVATGVAVSGDVSITNAGVTSVVTASTTVAGKIEIATGAEVLAGSSTSLATTPAGVDGYFTGLVGNATGTQHLGTFSGSTIADSVTVKAALQALETAIEAVAGGPTFLGAWDATTADPTGAMGNNTYYRVSVAGTTSITTANFGVVATWAVGDFLLKADDGSIHKIDNTDDPVNLGVASVTHTTLDVTSSTGTSATIPAAVASTTATAGNGTAGLMSGNEKFKVANTNGYAASYGDGATLSYALTHSLGTLDVHVQVYRNSDGVQVYPDIARTSTNVVTVTHGIAPAASAMRVVVSRVSVT